MDATLAWPAAFTPQDDGSILVTFRDLPEALTDGDDDADALAQAADCLATAVAVRLARGEPVPRSKPARGERPIPLDPGLAAKLLLRDAMAEAATTPAALARKLRCRTAEVRRMLDPGRPSDMAALQGALRALGWTLGVTARRTGVARREREASHP
jgi:antitoxin HicB